MKTNTNIGFGDSKKSVLNAYKGYEINTSKDGKIEQSLDMTTSTYYLSFTLKNNKVYEMMLQQNQQKTRSVQKRQTTQKGKQTELRINGTIERVNIQEQDTLLKVKLSSNPKKSSENATVSFSKGSVISILFKGTPEQYSPSGKGGNVILDVEKGVDISVPIVYQPQRNGIKRTSDFNGYLFKKNGVYLNWKGQSFGSHP